MAREAVVGTVHKPQPPEVPEPEGWAFMYRPIDSEGTWPWRFGMTELRGRKWAESRALDFARDRELVRLVHIGPAPKVPVRDIQLAVSTLRAAANSTELGARESLLNCAARLTHWLGESEREKGGRE